MWDAEGETFFCIWHFDTKCQIGKLIFFLKCILQSYFTKQQWGDHIVNSSVWDSEGVPFLLPSLVQFLREKYILGKISVVYPHACTFRVHQWMLSWGQSSSKLRVVIRLQPCLLEFNEQKVYIKDRVFNDTRKYSAKNNETMKINLTLKVTFKSWFILIAES